MVDLDADRSRGIVSLSGRLANHTKVGYKPAESHLEIAIPCEGWLEYGRRRGRDVRAKGRKGDKGKDC